MDDRAVMYWRRLHRRSHRAVAVVVAGALAGLALAGLAGVAPRALRGSPAGDAPCVLDAGRDIAPRLVPFKGEATVTLGLRVTCDVTRQPLHIVLAVDASRDMSGEELDTLKQALGDAVKTLDMGRRGKRPWVKIGILSFTGAPKAEGSALIDDPDIVGGLINNIQTDGSICDYSPELLCGPALGLREALAILNVARRADTPDAEARQVIVLASGADHQLTCPSIRAQAAEVQRSGVLLVTTCAGNANACARGCLADVASQARFHLRSDRWAFLDRLLAQMADAVGPFNPIERVAVVDDLSDDLLFIGSGDPGLTIEGHRLTWTFDPPAMDAASWAVTRTYRIQALDCGQIQSSRGVTATIRYAAQPWGGVERSFGLQNPVLSVPCPSATPTAPPAATPSDTPDPATPSVTATATGYPTPTPTASVTRPAGSTTATASTTPGTPPASPSPSPTPKLARAYLPYLANEACAALPGAVPVAVVLAFDVSGSMERPAGGLYGDVDRLSAAADIARRGILGVALRPEVDRAAVVQFGQSGDVVAELGSCCAGALAGVAVLGRSSWSFPWHAIDRAAAILAAGRYRPDERLAIVLLTDLAPADLSDADAALLAASADGARGAGIAVYAVGLGDTADADFLARVTGAADRVYLSRRLLGGDPSAVVGHALRCGW